MKILNKKILNKAATFLLTAVLLCYSVIPVKAENLTQIEYLYIGDDVLTVEMGVVDYPFDDGVEDDNTGSSSSLGIESVVTSMVLRDSGQYPKLISSYFTGNKGVFCYEDTIQLTGETLASGYSYIGCETGAFGFDVRFTTLTSAAVYAQITDVSVIVPGSPAYKCDFYGGYEQSAFVEGFNSGILPMSIFSELGFPMFYLEYPAELIIEVGIRYDVVVDDVSGVYNSHYFNLEYNFTGDNAMTVYRVPGDHRSIQLDTVIEQNNTLLGKLTSWFEALFKRMDEKQNEQLHGYQDSTITEAANAFSSESDKLTALEEELSTQSNTYVTDYAAEGFDLGVLGTLGSSLIFVTTWFTNFWNMGGVFTAALNFCFALSIVFFILRIKR